MTGNYAIIVLAAGLSSRMAGRNKLLLPLGDAPIVRRTAINALASGIAPVIVVTGHEASAVQSALDDLPVTFAHNPHFARGMGSSLICGLTALDETINGAIIMLGDMPLIGPGIIREVAVTASLHPAASAVVPVYQGAWAHPVLLNRNLFPAVMELNGDTGARALLKQRTDVHLQPVTDEGCLLDADTENAYEIVRQRYAERMVNGL